MVEDRGITVKLSKALWNKCLENKQDPSNGRCLRCASLTPCKKHLMNASRNRKNRKRTFADVLENEQILYLLNSLKNIFTADILSSLMPSTKYECLVSGLSNMTVENVINHIVSLRIECVQRHIRPILQKYMFHPKNADIFNAPVDTEFLGLADYFKRIKYPMDLSTARGRLLEGKYETYEEAFSDLLLVFENAISYNPCDTLVHQNAKFMLDELNEDISSFKEKLEKEEDKKALHSCSLCLGAVCALCGEKCLKFESSMLVCQCGQRIKKNCIYYVSTDGNFLWCQKCYTAAPPIIAENFSNENPLSKRDLLKRRFDEEVAEPWVQCSICERWIHQICAMFTDLPNDIELFDSTFTCPLCKLDRMGNSSSDQLAAVSKNMKSNNHQKRRKIENADVDDFKIISENDGDETKFESDSEFIKAQLAGSSDTSVETCESDTGDFTYLKDYNAKRLLKSKLSNFIEEMVFERLRVLGRGDVSDSLTIRVVSNVKLCLDVPDVIVHNMRTPSFNKVSKQFQYTQKCILLFQKIDGIDVCLFCLYVQEFDSTCPEPNKSRVNIAYLDSVEYFRPREMRTVVFHEILIAYLKWAHARGFQFGHIWACPPQRGDNFIFWCHPLHQRTPSRDRLNNWYSTMLRRALALGICNTVSTMYNEYFAPYYKREEASPRTASKNSYVSKNISSKSSNQLMGNTSGNTEDTEYDVSQVPVCPPVFEGDMWVNDILRVHKLVQLRSKNVDGRDKNANIRRCRDILKNIMSRSTAYVFLKPVDPVALNIPDYYDIIQTPMDLGTVREKLRSSLYKTIQDFAVDINLTFQNAIRYNPPGHPIHLAAKKLQDDFDHSMVDLITERVGTMLGENLNLDKWLRTYPLSCAPNCVDSVLEAGIKSDVLYESNTSAEVNKHVSFADQTPWNDVSTEVESSIHCGTVIKPWNNSDYTHDDDNSDETVHMSYRLSRHDSVESITSCIDEDSWLQRSNPNAVLSYSDTDKYDYPLIPFEQPELGIKGINALMSELSRNVMRLKEDMFVIKFQSPNSQEETQTSTVELKDLNDNNEFKGKASGGKGKGLGAILHAAAGEILSSSHSTISSKCLSLLDCIVPDTSDPDEVIKSPFVDSRQTFLEMCQFKRYQFDSLRRAKHSSMMLLHHLFHPYDENLRPACINCHELIKSIRWHCEQCATYDVCATCFTTKNLHEHPLTPFRVSYI